MNNVCLFVWLCFVLISIYDDDDNNDWIELKWSYGDNLPPSWVLYWLISLSIIQLLFMNQHFFTDLSIMCQCVKTQTLREYKNIFPSIIYDDDYLHSTTFDWFFSGVIIICLVTISCCLINFQRIKGQNTVKFFFHRIFVDLLFIKTLSNKKNGLVKFFVQNWNFIACNKQ